MIDKRTVLVSILGGIAITLITGLIPKRVLAGGTHYGWPMAWLIRLVLAPHYFPWKVLPTWLVIDVILWGLLVFILYYYLRNR